MIVGSGVVLAASYEARARGVRGAMGGARARGLCPDAIVVQPRMSAYTQASKDVFEVFRGTTPLVEGVSIDEAFLDVGGLGRVSGTPTEIAVRLRREVLEQVGLRITVGVAKTKFLAKVASAVAKPDGLLVVPAGTELDFLHPLPVQRLWGVGPVNTAKLHQLGIYTVGQVAGLGEAGLISILGQASGRHLHALAHNRDPRRVKGGRRRRSIGSQHALGRSRHRPADIDAVAMGLVDRVTRRMRDAEPDRTDRRAPAPLRRLLPGEPFAHPDPVDRADGDHPVDGARADRRRDADDRGQGPDPGRDRRWQPRRRVRAARAAVRCAERRRAGRRPRWCPGAVRVGLRSPVPRYSAATRAWRCPCCPTDWLPTVPHRRAQAGHRSISCVPHVPR